MLVSCGWGAAPQGLAGHWSVGDEQLHCVSLVLDIITIIFPSFSVLFNSCVLPFPNSLSHPALVWGE